jgi:transposase, IS605 OrfB family, central region
LEDLKVKNMSASAKGTTENPGKNVKAKSGLNRSILDQGWYEFRRQLEYKQQWAGGKLIIVPPANTSLKCSACGHISKANRISQSRFRCTECGHKEHADLNAAKNILSAGQAELACGDIGQIAA